MVKVNVDLSKTAPFVAAPEIEGLSHLAKESNKALHNGTGKGNDFLGWVNLPFEITNEHILDIKQAAATLSKDVDVVVVIGIGGSYLGAKAVIDALSNSFSQYTKGAHPIS